MNRKGRFCIAGYLGLMPFRRKHGLQSAQWVCITTAQTMKEEQKALYNCEETLRKNF